VSKNKIKPIRQKIDAIDHQILKLIQRRGSLAQKIGKLKSLMSSNTSFYKPKREAEILRNISKLNNGPISENKVNHIFKEIISSCLSLEEELTIAYLGPEGTHSEGAAIQHFGSSPIRSPRSTIEDVFHQVRTGSANFGIVPVENSSEGVVNATLNSLADEEIKICGETYLPIHHQLASARKFKLEDTKIVASHPQALGQCSKWLDANLPNAKRETTSSTAEAAKLSKAHPKTLCIVSSLAINKYNLHQYQKDIEDFSGNNTRFLVIGNIEIEQTKKDKTSLLIQTDNQPGALIKILEPFNKRKINLERIETRPSRESLNSHNFFIDSTGHYKDAKLKQVIANLKELGASVRILGSYPSDS
jgi:chorismate mutase/prephenate dehydratase